jgi:hypothetical protein
MFSVIYKLEFNNSLDKLRLKTIDHYTCLLSMGAATNTALHSTAGGGTLTVRHNLTF